MALTLAQRVTSFRVAYAKWPASWPWLVTEKQHEVLYAIWVLGADYRNRATLYGTYPPGFLARVMALFPDATGRRASGVLHAFSGALSAGAYWRLDLVRRTRSRRGFLQGSVYDAPHLFRRQSFRLVIADPPYSPEDAKRYGTASVDRRRALAALAEVAAPGAHLAWLDTTWPMHSKRQWVTVGRILVQRSTNHRVRVLSLFERQRG